MSSSSDAEATGGRAFQRLTERGAWMACCGVGVAVRVLMLAGRSLWHDEIYTIELARTGAVRILEALAHDTGPPLFYLLASLVVGREAGPLDTAVRLFSLAASLLHLPLLVRIGSHVGREDVGWRAAGLFALCPLAVHFGAEARGYALASLLALAALERSLDLRVRASKASVVVLALCCAGAVLTHYLAVFPLLGLPLLLVRADAGGRRRLLAGWSLGAVLAAAWLPVALGQPAAGMAWVRLISTREKLGRLLLNFAFGVDRMPNLAVALAAIAFLGVVAWRLAGTRGAARAVLGVLAVGVGAVAAAAALRPNILIPVRTVVCFLPLLTLALALAGRACAAVAAVVYVVALADMVPGSLTAVGGEQVARFLMPAVRDGRTVCVAGLEALEVDYHLRRAGLRTHVVYFPSDTRSHPGWYDDRLPSSAQLRAEARAVTDAADRPDLYVLPHGARASTALRERLQPQGARSVGYNGLVEVLALPGKP